MQTNFSISSDFLGYMAAALTSIAFVPQVIRTWRTKKGDDVSIWMLMLFISGLLFWIVYAIQIDSIPVLIANIITFTLNISILLLKLYFSSQ